MRKYTPFICSDKLSKALKPQHYQQGVALITAMVIMAIAVSLAATLAYRQQVSIRLSGNLTALEQAYVYASDMEDFAGSVLRRDFQDSTIDSLDEEWATPGGVTNPVPGGFMTGQLYDLQARINLNDIVESKAQNNQTVQNPHADRFNMLNRLLAKLQIQKGELVYNLIDWVDNNEQETQSGVESSYYRTLEQPYLAANSSLVSFSELRLIKGFTDKVTNNQGQEEDILVKVAPFVTTLPANKIKINVNTAPNNVLYALGNVTESQVSGAIEDREEKAFANVQDFIASLGFANPQPPFPTYLLSVNSNYFFLDGRVEIGKVRVFIKSTIYRDNQGRTRVISREFSET